jgi:hypothetical protein
MTPSHDRERAEAVNLWLEHEIRSNGSGMRSSRIGLGRFAIGA